jgi:carotenoid cleavage dioxygenase-like enzyme
MRDHDDALDLERRALIRAVALGLPVAALSSLWPNMLRAAGESKQTTASPIYTLDHYQPTQSELTATNLKVIGTIPPELSGRYFRNGHNPKPDLIPPFWFGGNGMIHGVRLNSGRAEWYRNRFVRTPALEGARTFRDDGSVDLAASAAATSVFAHAGRILALQEINLPYLLGPELQTLGVFDFDGKLKQPMTAHPKIDPRTGEMLFISYGPTPPHLSYFQVSPQGELTHAEPVPGAGPSIMHDFAITENYVIFLDPSVVFDADSKQAFPYQWADNYQAKVGVMPRDRSKGPVRWIPVDPFFYFHISNAWESGDALMLESTFYDRDSWQRFSKWLMSQPGHDPYLVQGNGFARWRIEPAAGRATREIRSDISADFPTINPTLLGRRNRYTYASAFPSGSLKRHALVKYDVATGNVSLREFSEGQMPEEPWFVPTSSAKNEDDGWLFSFVGDLKTRRGALHILDAASFNAKPVAIIEIPGWVPAGVHGSWIDDATLHG